MIIELSGLGLGLIGLWLGTEWTVNNAILVAERANLSEAFIGMGLLAIGSDLPELAVAIDAGIKNLNGLQVSDLIIGSSLGSAFAQIGLVVGITGLAGYLVIGRAFVIRHGSVLIGATAILWLLGIDNKISRGDGLILLVLFLLYFFLLLRQETEREIVSKPNTARLYPLVLKVLAGIATVIAGSEITVLSAKLIAERFEIPQIIIATFIIGIGTSLPELSISLQAIRKNKAALSVGNILGSNIFDTLVPIGAAAVIFPIKIDNRVLAFDLPMLVLLTLVTLLFFYYKRGLQRKEAIAILCTYGAYVAMNMIFRSHF